MLESLGEPYYARLLTALTEDPDWFVTDAGDSIETAIEIAAEGGYGEAELHLSHQYTDASLYVLCPDYWNEAPVRLQLEQALDPRLPDSEADFIGDLLESQHDIATTYRSEYVTAETDPQIIASAVVPIEYDQRELQTSLDSFASIAYRIARLHADIRGPVENYLQFQPTDNSTPQRPFC